MKTFLKAARQNLPHNQRTSSQNSSVRSQNPSAENNAEENSKMLHTAIKERNIPAIQKLLSNDNLDVNAVNEHNFSPLFSAVWNHNPTKGVDNAEIVQLLLQHSDIDVNTLNGHGYTPLSDASMHGNTKIVQLLLQHKHIDVNGLESMQSPLYLAAGDGHIEVVQLLLQHKNIDVNIEYVQHRSIEGEIVCQTPLEIACKKGHTEVVKLLLRHEKINLKSPEFIYLAAMFKYIEIIELLLQHKDIDGYSILYQLRNSKEQHIKIVKFLIATGYIIKPSHNIPPVQTTPAQITPAQAIPDKTILDETIPDKIKDLIEKYDSLISNPYKNKEILVLFINKIRNEFGMEELDKKEILKYHTSLEYTILRKMKKSGTIYNDDEKIPESLRTKMIQYGVKLSSKK
jgi:ankyrin repeat protein